MNNCHFCNKKIRSISSNDYLINAWFICDFCNVTYMYDDDNILEMIRFKTILNDEQYCLDLFLKKSTSEISHFPINPKRSTVILRLPFLVQGITPFNYQDKIKTYIMFS